MQAVGEDEDFTPEAELEGNALRLLGGRDSADRLQSVCGGGYGQCPWRRKRRILEGQGGDFDMAGTYGWLQLTLEEGYFLAFDRGKPPTYLRRATTPSLL